VLKQIRCQYREALVAHPQEGLAPAERAELKQPHPQQAEPEQAHRQRAQPEQAHRERAEPEQAHPERLAPAPSQAPAQQPPRVRPSLP
jgi:hypothetical protein